MNWRNAMERKIKISVIIPVYNTEDYLETCLDSLFLQKYQDVEFILVDDGSTDNSLNLCNKYAAKDNRFVVIHKENGGPSSARNIAIENAKGEYITFVDSDDFVSYNAYQEIANLLNKHENPDALVFGAKLVPEYAPQYMWDKVNTRDVVYNEFNPSVLYSEVGARPFLWLQVVKKSIIVDNKIKMDESINLGEDQLFQIEFFPFTKKVVFVSNKFYHYRWQRGNSLMAQYSRDKIKKLLQHVNLIKKVFTSVFTNKYSIEMKRATLVWSIFFMYGDLRNLLEQEQAKVASELVKVWRTFKYKDYLKQVDVWGKLRLNQIILMSEIDRDKRIENYEKAILEITQEIEELKKDPQYEKLINQNKHVGKIKALFSCLKTYGLRRTLKGFFSCVKSYGLIKTFKIYFSTTEKYGVDYTLQKIETRIKK